VTALDDWIDGEALVAAGGMLRAVSATNLVKDRPGFGQRIVPRPGSVVASPVLAAYDPDPDYVFHWFRDSAIVIDALRVAIEDGLVDATAVERLSEFVAFSRSLRGLDGRALLRDGGFKYEIQPPFQQYVRPDKEIAAVFGEAALAEARVNADGTLDFTRWARPQNDGAALEVLALSRWRTVRPGLPAALLNAMVELAASDLDFIRARARETSFDIWEEERGFHYFTQLVQAEALVRGAEWLEEAGDAARASACRTVADEFAPSLDAYWSETDGFYRARIGGAPQKALDIAVILGVLHAGRAKGVHSVLDPKAQATLAALEDGFDREYPINRERPADRGPAMGRYASDAYYGGNPWYLATLAAAELHFRLAAALAPGAGIAAAIERGDMFMRTVKAYTPPSGDLSEQFDRTTGAQISAKQLAWSYAAFITAAASRRRACAAIQG
jgi:glucoamylase